MCNIRELETSKRETGIIGIGIFDETFFSKKQIISKIHHSVKHVVVFPLAENACFLLKSH